MNLSKRSPDISSVAFMDLGRCRRVQELKVKILVQEEGEGAGEKMVSLAIFPAKTTPIILPVHKTNVYSRSYYSAPSATSLDQ